MQHRGPESWKKKRGARLRAARSQAGCSTPEELASARAGRQEHARRFTENKAAGVAGAERGQVAGGWETGAQEAIYVTQV